MRLSRLRKAAVTVVAALASAALASLALFAAVELRPGLAVTFGLVKIRYYALKWADYRPDPVLVFDRRQPPPLRGKFPGDLYLPEYGPAQPFDYSATYTPDGFRANSSRPPYEVVVVGDSFVEAGSDDSLTLSERLRARTGLPALNLGRSWYGPPQYVEVLRRYGLPHRPRVALLCFFSGNDAEDAAEYERWSRGGDYYFYKDLSSMSFPRRYLLAASDAAAYARWALGRRAAHFRRDARLRLAVVRTEAGETPMAFNNWGKAAPADELLASPEWRLVGQSFAAFRDLCRAAGARPVVVYVPRKEEVYAGLAAESSGEDFKTARDRFLPFADAPGRAARRLAEEAGLEFIDLLPEFRRRAGEGRLLFHPFDTHWNRDGIDLAAELIAPSLRR